MVCKRMSESDGFLSTMGYLRSSIDLTLQVSQEKRLNRWNDHSRLFKNGLGHVVNATCSLNNRSIVPMNPFESRSDDLFLVEE